MVIIRNRKIIGYFLFYITLIVTNSEVLAQQKYNHAVDRMLAEYPEATLQDIYKSFFQDCFGPGHLIGDTIGARQYLNRELAEMEDTALPYYELAGAGENYYRVSLAVIKDGIVPADDFFDIFVESAGKVTFPTIEDWSEKWAEILKIIPASIEHYSTDKAMIDSLLAGGKYAVHHSLKFNEAYHPHYRLIDKNTFESRLLPLITSRTSSLAPTIMHNDADTRNVMLDASSSKRQE